MSNELLHEKVALQMIFISKHVPTYPNHSRHIILVEKGLGDNIYMEVGISLMIIFLLIGRTSLGPL